MSTLPILRRVIDLYCGIQKGHDCYLVVTRSLKIHPVKRSGSPLTDLNEDEEIFSNEEVNDDDDVR